MAILKSEGNPLQFSPIPLSLAFYLRSLPTSDEIFDLTAEWSKITGREIGQSSSDFEDLVFWVSEKCGIEFAKKFEKRHDYPF